MLLAKDGVLDSKAEDLAVVTINKDLGEETARLYRSLRCNTAYLVSPGVLGALQAAVLFQLTTVHPGLDAAASGTLEEIYKVDGIRTATTEEDTSGTFPTLAQDLGTSVVSNSTTTIWSNKVAVQVTCSHRTK